ncbi:1529_t:CDS:2 [Acaulospora morrowiae]|uniref:1529_t:CDS:1 n=1 Tax=Acaulospora morrowiae TaxID=94023 RepID=A0A9N9FBI2_9GLOM|nr:1529_t:CDS:2 [Acaulospora morrowiae]
MSLRRRTLHTPGRLSNRWSEAPPYSPIMKGLFFTRRLGPPPNSKIRNVKRPNPARSGLRA